MAKKLKNVRPPVKKVKRKREKSQRSAKLRVAMAILYSFCIVLTAFPFTEVSFEKRIDTEEDVAAMQRMIDESYDNLKKAMDGLEENPNKDEEIQANRITIRTPKELNNDIGKKCETDKLLELLNEAADLNNLDYTVESYNKMSDAIYDALSTLTQRAMISETCIQLAFGASASSSYSGERSGTLERFLYSILFLVVPVAGFFISSFDRKRHIKNIFAIVGSAAVIVDFFLFFPLNIVGDGAVYSVIIYFIIFILGFVGLYVKQQEDYWYKNYELAIEKGQEKWLPDGFLADKKTAEQIKEEKEHQAIIDAAKNAEKRRNKKK